MHIEDDIELVAKNCWDNFEKVKLVFRKIIYTNYHYLQNFMANNSFQTVNALVISIADLKRI